MFLIYYKNYKYVFVESGIAFFGLKCTCTCILMVTQCICRHIIYFFSHCQGQGSIVPCFQVVQKPSIGNLFRQLHKIQSMKRRFDFLLKRI